MAKFLEFNTRVLGRHLDILKKSITRDYDYHYSVDFLLKDKLYTKLRMIRLYRFDDQIDTIFFSEILSRFEIRPIPNCAFQPNI